MPPAARVDLPAALRDAGLRVTASRLAVLSVVRDGKHVTADQVAVGARQRVGAISTQAVYDVLAALRACPRSRFGGSVEGEGDGPDRHGELASAELVSGEVADSLPGDAPEGA